MTTPLLKVTDLAVTYNSAHGPVHAVTGVLLRRLRAGHRHRGGIRFRKIHLCHGNSTLR